MKTLPLISITLCLLAATPSLPAANLDSGKTLVEGNCTKCHDERVYTRPDRRVTTLDGLSNQVRRCEQSLGLKWFDEEIDNVAAYLNETYYHFNK
jgi:mono/diheme cytochrome c family protein